MEKAINSNYNNFEEVQNNLKAVVIGASGAIGRVSFSRAILKFDNFMKELVKELMSSPKWKEVHLIVRRSLPDWKKYEGKLPFPQNM